MVKINENQCNGIDKLGIPAKWDDLHTIGSCFIDLSGSNLLGIKLNGTNMQDSDMVVSNLDGSDLTGAKLRGAKISKSQKDKIEWV